MPITLLTAEQAIGNLASDPLARWPEGRGVGERLGAYPVCALPRELGVSRDDLVFTAGARIARDLGERLAVTGFTVPTLEAPAGLLDMGTSAALLNALRWSLGLAAFPKAGLLALDDGRVCDPHLDPALPPLPPADAMARRAEVQRLMSVLPQCRLVVLVLGGVEAWHDGETGLYLDGAPPEAVLRDQPARFSLHRLDPGDIAADLEAIHAILTSYGHPDFRLLLAVSPEPVAATWSGQDAIVADGYAKAALRAAAEAFTVAHDRVGYLPILEMVTLADRARAFDADGVHVRPKTTARIVAQVVAALTGSAAPGARDPGRFGDDPRPLYAAAMTALGQGQNERAVDLLRRIEAADMAERCGADVAEFSFRLGVALARIGENGDAEIHLLRAVALAPDRPDYHGKLGMVAMRLRRASAIRHMEAAVTLAPDDAACRRRLAAGYFRLGEVDRAIAAQREALRMEPGLARAQATLDAYLEAAARSAEPA